MKYWIPMTILVMISLFLLFGFTEQQLGNTSFDQPTDGSLSKYPLNLSEYGFFTKPISEQVPASGVLPYALNSPLFSDYAKKLRFIQLPEGARIDYNDQDVFEFPVGTTLIKTFYYPTDFRKPEKGRTLMETRLLIHEAGGWKALAYHWNETQDEAVLEVAGDKKFIKWTDEKGKKQKLDYVLPNQNDCKACHSYDGKIKPIGPSARQLNGAFDYTFGQENQLAYWAEQGLLHNMPDIETVPKAAIWNDPQSGDLDERARIWLDINCAHCHNPHGPANTSGFFLDYHQRQSSVLGIFKPPVAAGRGAGERDYDIDPGNPESSILYYRIISNDPGIMMPEIGRKMIDKEGVLLIYDWIKAMDPSEYD